MTAPLLAAVEFGTGLAANGADYRRLTHVFRYTAAQHCGHWTRRIDRIEPEPYVSDLGNPSHVWNTQKLRWWRDVVRASADGDRVLLIDADMIIVRPLDAAWDQPFDMAYTIRRHRLPFNGGVLFLRISDRVRAFMEAWWDANLRFLLDAQAHAPWREKYAGINQASFGYVLDTVDHGCRLAQLPCDVWNCEASGWATFNPKVTRIVHVKSKLRQALFGRIPPVAYHRPILKLWRSLEQAANAAELV